MKNKIEMGLRILIGALLLMSGLNKFFNFMPTPEMTDSAGSFMMALFSTGYIFPIIGFIEIVGGALLISGKLVPFAFIILAPIVINIALFHIILDPAGIGISLFLIGSMGWFAWNRKDAFSGLFL
ncbi:MAG: DoxX family protein [Fidelibacterota bacterium]